MAAQINHLFVLMMENRSFDHMLGFLKSLDYNIEGLDPANLPFNETIQEERIFASPDAVPTGDLGYDPNHHFPDVMEQIYGLNPAPYPPGPGQNADMSGFVRNYERKAGSAAAGANIMKCFNPTTLPVLNTLAKMYAVCDHWYSSIPGPTLPNRLYVHCGTSRGRLDMAPEYYSGFYTVYEELAKHGVSSTIFWTDWSGTLSFSGLLAHQNLFYTDYAQFAEMCKGDARNVPAYCFIEPQYSPSDDIGGTVTPESDQHPDSDVRDGEVLIRDVYNAIRANDDLWHSSMLVIIYDEHGGLFDHVPPVPMTSPDGLSSLDPAFDFKLSGLRVPAIVISPYVRPAQISDTVFDHTSVIATALKLFTDTWPTDALYDRAKNANTLDTLLDLNMQPRDEWPDFPEPNFSGIVKSISAEEAAAAPLSDLQAEAVHHAISLNNSLPPANRLPPPALEDLTHAKAAGAFVQAVGKAAVAAHQVLK